MSSSLNWPIVDPSSPGAHHSAAGMGNAPPGSPGLGGPASALRRTLLHALVMAAGLGLQPQSLASPLTGLMRWGSGEFRRFGFLVYTATLWAGDAPLRPPLALRLDYQRSITGNAIVEASLREMRRFVDDPEQLKTWAPLMRQVFPNVQPGDHILGLYTPNGATFYQGERQLGRITAPDFAAAFFAIWLDNRTSAPDLRAALLTRPAG